MSERLAGKRALVVGASRGIGKAIARTFANEGADVAMAARSIDVLEDLSNNIAGDSIALQCDLRETEAVNRTVEQAVEEFGGLDVIVNTVGVLTRGKVTDASDEDFEYVVDVNVLGMLRLARAGIPELAETDGTLITISSEAAEKGVPDLPAYCATKGATNTLTKQLAIDYSDDNVRVNAISPGTTKTSMNEEVRQTDPEWEEIRKSGIPLGRLGTPDDMAGAAVFLASDEASYITGEIIAVDGGSTAQ
ncbi:SDR family oxidoreductase [Halobacteria archaeon AArc-curdl1]|uniref:SDR family oxidoreductase n=1 Tax=Natronosalvus hydrolyticus TaxID=2979988 RepID=A0AAP2Z6D1_9EURY|nr:SDR family oxidoreductase [Halobacteria archaeon AArc-curdl1]